jgi:hypothetical protein
VRTDGAQNRKHSYLGPERDSATRPQLDADFLIQVITEVSALSHRRLYNGGGTIRFRGFSETK